MAPAVDLQHLLLHSGQVLHPRPQGAVEEGPVEGQVFVVHPGEEDVVIEDLLVQSGAPGGHLPQHHGVAGKLQKEIKGVAVQVALGQVVPEKLQGGAVLRGDGAQFIGPIHV